MPGAGFAPSFFAGRPSQNHLQRSLVCRRFMKRAGTWYENPFMGGVERLLGVLLTAWPGTSVHRLASRFLPPQLPHGGRSFPLSLLASHMSCPNCGERPTRGGLNNPVLAIGPFHPWVTPGPTPFGLIVGTGKHASANAKSDKALVSGASA